MFINFNVIGIENLISSWKDTRKIWETWNREKWLQHIHQTKDLYVQNSSKEKKKRQILWRKKVKTTKMQKAVHRRIYLNDQLLCHSDLSNSATPWTAATQTSLSFTVSRSLFKLMSTDMSGGVPSNTLILCPPLLLLLSIISRIRVFSNESTLHHGDKILEFQLQ